MSAPYGPAPAGAPDRGRTSRRGSVRSAISETDESLPASAFFEQFARLAGGASAVIAIISCAATNPAGTGEAYAARFREAGAGEATWLRLWQRCDANGAATVAELRRATGIVITGGDHARMRSLLADTRAMEMIHKRRHEGAAVAGSDAAATLLATSDMALGMARDEEWRAAFRPGAGGESRSAIDLVSEPRGLQNAEWFGF